MALSREYADFVRDVLSVFGPVVVRPMFGGGGVYLDGVMFGLIAEDVLYLRGDEASAGDFSAHGKGPFVYQPKGRKPISMPYWEVPEHLYDDPDALSEWAGRAHEIARREKAKKRGR